MSAMFLLPHSGRSFNRINLFEKKYFSLVLTTIVLSSTTPVLFHYWISRPMMATNSFAWIPTHQKSASSIRLESGQTSDFSLVRLLFELKWFWWYFQSDLPISAQCGSLKISWIHWTARYSFIIKSAGNCTKQVLKLNAPLTAELYLITKLLKVILLSKGACIWSYSQLPSWTWQQYLLPKTWRCC